MSATNEEFNIGNFIVDLVTNLLSWLKGSSAIPTRDSLEAVELRNLQLKETQLQNVLEDLPASNTAEILGIQEAITQQENRIVRQFNLIEYLKNMKLPNQFSDFQRFQKAQRAQGLSIAAARAEIVELNAERENLFNQQTALFAEREEIFANIDNLLATQQQFGAESLADIRERINSLGGTF